MIEELQKLGCFGDAKVMPPQGEMIPKLQAADALVFKDFFLCGLHFPVAHFVCQVLEAFEVQLHHLTPSGIVTLSMFCTPICLMVHSPMMAPSASTMSSSVSLSGWAKASW